MKKYHYSNRIHHHHIYHSPQCNLSTAAVLGKSTITKGNDERIVSYHEVMQSSSRGRGGRPPVKNERVTKNNNNNVISPRRRNEYNNNNNKKAITTKIGLNKINERIRNCQSLQDLLELHKMNKNRMLPFHVSSCWNRASHLIRIQDKIINKTKKNDTIVNDNNENSRAMLFPLMKQTIATIDKFNTRSLTTTLNGMTRMSSSLRHQKTTTMYPEEELWKTLEKKVAMVAASTTNNKNSTSLSPHDIGNIFWSFAKAGRRAPELFDLLTMKIISNGMLDTFTTQSISNMIWAYAKVGHVFPEFLDIIAQTAITKIQDFTPYELSNIVWAYAKSHHDAPELFDAVAQRLIRNNARVPPSSTNNNNNNHHTFIEELKPRDVATIVWSYAKADHPALPELFDALLSKKDIITSNINFYQPKDVSKMAWAYAKATASSSQTTKSAEDQKLLLFDAIAQHIIKNPTSFTKSHLISTLLWSYAKVGYYNNNYSPTGSTKATLLLDVLTQNAIDKIHTFKYIIL